MITVNIESKFQVRLPLHWIVMCIISTTADKVAHFPCCSYPDEITSLEILPQFDLAPNFVHGAVKVVGGIIVL